MQNLLTGKPAGTPDPQDPMTADEHLAAMRRLLHGAAGASHHAAVYVAAADVHVKAAELIGRKPQPVKTAPARTLPRDGDAL